MARDAYIPIQPLVLKRSGGRSERELWEETERKINEVVDAVNRLSQSLNEADATTASVSPLP